MIYLIVAVLTFGLIIWGVIGIWQRQKSNLENNNSRISSRLENLSSEPTKASEQNIRDILVCKSEFEGLRAKAEMTGAGGMLVMNTHSADDEKCELTIKNMRAAGDLGTITLSVHAEQENFGITLKMTAAHPEEIRLWAEAALLYFKAEISEETAANAVKAALEEGSYTDDLFTLTVKTDVVIDGSSVTPQKIIEIREN
ncbi:MAG: hypothetical protein IJI57_07970 [Flexilinea sp.]|nr:hypothetical protein [Flexilinea sp.]